MTDDAYAEFSGSRRRLLEELTTLRERFPRARMLSPGMGAPLFEATVEVDARAHHLRMTLPPAYPRVPPEVRELEAPGGRVVPPRPGNRRLPDGQLCLFTHGSDPDTWHQGRTLAEAVDKAMSFLAIEAQAREAGGTLVAARRRLLVGPAVVELFKLTHGHGTLVAASVREKARESFVIEASNRDPCFEYPVSIAEPWLEQLSHRATIPWARLPDDAPSWKVLLQGPASLREGLGRTFGDAAYHDLQRAMEMVLVRQGGDGLEVFLVQRDPLDLTVLRASPVEQGEPDAVLFNRVDGVSPGRAMLSSIPVTIVGAGSLGGAVALALARAGAGELLLIDHDTLALDNVCRHVGTVAQVGEPKVEVVARAIRGVNPAARVRTIEKPLAWDIPDFGAGLEFERWLEHHPSALVVSTCAFGPVERQLNEILVRRRIPAVYASVLGPGHHGRVHRVLPGQTPCYECILTAQNTEPLRFPRYVVDGVDQESRVPYLQPSLPGLAIDIGQIAAVTARLVLQTIARVQGIDLGLPDEVGDHLLWTNRGGWAFDRPHQIRVERPPRDEHCAVCGHTDADDALSDTEQAQLEALLSDMQ